MSIDLPLGAECFIDANVLVYHFADRETAGQLCTQFLQRVADGSVLAYVTVPVLADVLHKIMLIEVRARCGLDRTGLVAWIRRHPDCLDLLTQTQEACEQLRNLPLRLLPLDLGLLHESVRISRQHRLLTGDATIVALMHRHRLTNLVTNDDDFDGVPGLTVWKPR